MFSLSGKRALVTGGSRGIGGATTRLLAQCGADVVVHYRSRTAEAEAMVGEVRGLGRDAMAIPAELSDRAAVDAMYDQVEKAWGRLDIFVANAGIWPEEDVAVADMSDDRWRRTVAENIDGMFYSTRGALQLMGEGGASCS
ncbi:MAG: SDR family NAD(P)-dependent oxidoreductase [Gemmatimonadaceae bacterium]